MSRRPTRAANVQKRAQLRDARIKRAAGRANAGPIDAGIRAADALRARSQGATKSRTDAARERLWTALLVGGAAVAFGLLGREIADAFADRARPTFLQNDIYSALTSAAILAIVGVFAYRRWRLSRSVDPE